MQNLQEHHLFPLSVELGIWQGDYKNLALSWLRWWDNRGHLLLSGEERAERLAARFKSDEYRF